MNTQLKERNGEISIFIQLKLKRTVGRCMILEPENRHTKRDSVLKGGSKKCDGLKFKILFK